MIREYIRGKAGWLVFLFLVVVSNGAGADVEFTIIPHKHTITLGEPLVVSTIVRNVTSRPIDIFYQNSPAYYSLGIAILRLSEDAPPVLDESLTISRWFTNIWPDEFRSDRRIMPATITLAPGEEKTFELIVLYRRTVGFAFERPGRYWISAMVVVVAPEGGSPPNYRIAAEPMAITVREPAGSDRAAWEWLKAHQKEYGHLIQLPRTAELSDRFVSECRDHLDVSDSVYTEYLALSLSRWYSEGSGRDRAKATKYAEIAQTKASSEMVRKLASRPLQPLASVKEEPPKRP